MPHSSEGADIAPGSDGRRRRIWSRRILALAVSTTAALFAAEFAVRKFYGQELDTARLRLEHRNLSSGRLIEPAANPDLHYTLKRGIAEEWMGVIVATSREHPVRVSTFADSPPHPAIRVAMIGDSSSFGYYVDYDCTYAAMLRVQLEKAFDAPVEILNYSVPGHNTVQEKIVLEDLLAGSSPDLVILHYDHNDPDPQSATPPDYIAPEYGDNILNSSLLKLALRRMRVHRNSGSRLFFGEDGKEERLWNGHRSGGARCDAHLEDLRKMGALLARGETPAIAIIFESGIGRAADNAGADPHFETLHLPLAKVLEESGFFVFDLYPRYQALMKEKGWADLRPLWVTPGDGHPNATGRRIDILSSAPFASPVSFAF